MLLGPDFFGAVSLGADVGAETGVVLGCCTAAVSFGAVGCDAVAERGASDFAVVLGLDDAPSVALRVALRVPAIAEPPRPFVEARFLVAPAFGPDDEELDLLDPDADRLDEELDRVPVDDERVPVDEDRLDVEELDRFSVRPPFEPPFCWVRMRTTAPLPRFASVS